MKSKTILSTIFLILIFNALIAASPTISSFLPSTGPIGTLVTINGSNLSTPTAVTIGGQSAVVVSNTGSVLVAMVMPGSTSGIISITSTTGSATSTNNFIVVPTRFPSMQQGAKLVGSGNTGAASQARSVCLSADGTTAIIGGLADNAGIGAAWVYVRDGNSWVQQGSKLVGTGNVGTSRQGISVSISADGNTTIVGGNGDNENIGAAWVFIRNGTTWTQQGPKLVGSGNVGSSYQFAVSLSADGNTAILGGDNDNNALGAAWIFTRNGGVWTQQGLKLVGTGYTGIANQGQTVSLSADGNTALVGGPSDNDGIGAAWVFIRNGNVWSQQGSKLLGTGSSGSGASQGWAVCLSADGNTAISGGVNDNSNVGAAWIFTRNGSVWSQQGSKLVGTGGIGATIQGASVSLSADGNTAMIGGYWDNTNVGAAWIFARNNGLWSQQGSKFVGSGSIGEALQGISLSLSSDGNTAILGGDNDNNSQGAAWIFVSGSLTNQATDVIFTKTESISTTIGWSNGSGSSRAVFIAKASTGSPSPVNNTTYTANAAFGSGSQIGTSGWYCVYNGTGSTANITGLIAGTAYRVMVVEYNGAIGNQQYLTTTATGNPNNVTTLSSNAYLSFMKITGSGVSLSPAFAFKTTAYTANAPYTTTSVTVLPTTYVNTSTMKVNGVTLASGTTSRPIFLNVGSNTINITVTAQDGVTKETYTITVTRTLSNNAYLSYMKIGGGGAVLSPAFTFKNTSYTASVPNTTASVTVTPTTYVTTSTQTVNGTALASGTTSAAIPLNAGSNTINIVVTAQDGVTTLTYTITVTRAPGADNSLYQAVSVENPLTQPQLIDDGLLVHQALSPNGDGINDFLTIENISNYPDNKLLIMNRDGQLVFESKNYDNSTRVFDGHSNKTGQMQLPGTYFYALDYTVKGITKHKTGFLVLKY